MARRFQVIQGGKDREKKPGNGTPRLLRAYSIGDFTRGEMVYSEVRFNWYCLERSHPHIDYSIAIADHAMLSERDRRPLERTVDRFLSEAESAMLRHYLEQTFGLGLEVEDVPLPIQGRSHLFEEGSSVIYDFLELSERQGYDLPFKVWGYYTLTHSLGSPSMRNGIELLRKALDALEIADAFSDEDLGQVLSRIYREDGLLVKRRENP
ncbi:MAG: hypothetical protein MUF52_12425 [Syntrophobacteraceae bacterium]|nr:hypothetical protein [Syntrophobacteraceae bacterium]